MPSIIKVLKRSFVASEWGNWERDIEDARGFAGGKRIMICPSLCRTQIYVTVKSIHDKDQV